MRNTPPRDDHAPREHARSLPASSQARRRFLMALGAGTAGTAAVAAQAIAPAAIKAAPPPSEQGRGYQDTEHVRAYYATARI